MYGRKRDKMNKREMKSVVEKRNIEDRGRGGTREG